MIQFHYKLSLDNRKGMQRYPIDFVYYMYQIFIKSTETVPGYDRIIMYNKKRRK